MKDLDFGGGNERVRGQIARGLGSMATSSFRLFSFLYGVRRVIVDLSPLEQWWQRRSLFFFSAIPFFSLKDFEVSLFFFILMECYGLVEIRLRTCIRGDCRKAKSLGTVGGRADH